MAAENRLTADQLAALAPGGSVVIETSGDFRAGDPHGRARLLAVSSSGCLPRVRPGRR
jgi:hypothetical protein